MAERFALDHAAWHSVHMRVDELEILPHKVCGLLLACRHLVVTIFYTFSKLGLFNQTWRVKVRPRIGSNEPLCKAFLGQTARRAYVIASVDHKLAEVNSSVEASC